MSLKYKRVLLKLSGEALAGGDKIGISLSALKQIADDVIKAYKSNVQIGVVIGGGNIFRGVAALFRVWIVLALIIWECWPLVSML